MLRTLLYTGIATGLTLLANTALAQQSADGIEEITVTSNSRKSEGLADINAAVSVIGEEELRSIGHTHLQETLNRLPGVSIHRNNGQESLTAIRSPVLTGAGACGAFLVAENGIPVRSSGFCNVNEMFDLHAENAASVEVVRGPGSAFWGSNAVHGLVNVVLPKAGDARQITLEQGPRGSQRVKAQLGQDQGNFKQLLLVNGTSEEGYRDESGFDQQKLTYLYNYTTSNGWALDGGITHVNLNQETAGFVTGFESYKGASRTGNPNPEAHRDSKNTRAWTTFTKTLGDWDVVLTPYVRDIDMNFIQHFLPGQPVEETAHQSIGLQSVAFTDLANGAQLAVGFDAEVTDGSLTQTQPNPTAGSFFLRNSIPQGKHYDYQVDIEQVAAFVSYEQNFQSGWDLSLGLRVEDTNYDYDNRMIDGRTDEFGVACRFGCRYNRPGDRSDSFTNLSPKLGLSYALNDFHSVQLRAQRGFRAPQASEMYRLQNDQTIADLDSVELDSYEVEFKGAGEGWAYSAGYYFMDKQNEIVTNSARVNLNNSHTQHTGLEFSLGLDITETLALAAVYNFAEHTYENSEISGGIDIQGNNVDTAPRQFGNLRLRWTPSERVTSELELVSMGEYYTNPENTASYSGHNLLNLRTQYTVNDSVQIYANILNLDNREYAERADWTTFTDDRYFPGEPRRAFIGITINY
ncbi:TonB-dependent receptor [Gammaproteobacteria bacterium]|jgi:outer membrane receptor protein involved in Fe transport|nr:TonB-dependent receptor [Gammaproteobacteria bacterium]MDC3362267.1 TonB-dependent receptor [Gammaproteobacteria bacterium]